MNTFVVNDAESEAAKIRFRVANAIASNQSFMTVQHIVDDVAKRGDHAVVDYTKKLDGVNLKSLIVTSKEIEEAYTKVSIQQIKSIRIIRNRLAKTETGLLKNFLREIQTSTDGITFNRYVKPLQSTGCYIPGGKARYPSTVVMCVVPAKIAKVRRIVAISPPQKDGSIDPLTLVAADICGVDEFYKIGGAQGIAALAFGTSTIRKVNKIVGPGGVFVTIAKILASRNVAVDMVAGPTELLVYADSTSSSRLVALDIVSQAEHGYDSFCGLVTTSKRLASKVLNDIELIISKGNISRLEIVRKSLSKNGFVAIARDQSKAIAFANELAPEHLEILSNNARSISKRVTSAGLTLVGKYTPSSASDYCLGSNHVLPTMGLAKSRSSLSVLDFLKVVNAIEASRGGLNRVGRAIKEITLAEGLLNHHEAVKARLKGI
jgi:histidinol dehydrogenase